MKVDVPEPPHPGAYVGAWLTFDELAVLNTIASDLNLTTTEVIGRAIALAGAMRALHSFHGITPPHQRVGDDPLEGAIW